VRHGEIGLEFCRLFISGHRLVDHPAVLQRVAEVVPGDRHAGVQFDRTPQRCDGLIGLSKSPIELAAIGVQLGGIWIDGDGPRDHLQRDIVPPRPRGDHGPEMPRRRQFRLPVQDLRAEPLRLRQPPRPFVIHRQIECLPNCHR